MKSTQDLKEKKYEPDFFILHRFDHGAKPSPANETTHMPVVVVHHRHPFYFLIDFIPF